MANQVGGTAMTIVEARELAKWFGRRKIIEGLSITIQSGECHGIVGANGSGKSTVLSMLGSLLRPDAGSVTLFMNGKTIENPLHHSGLVAPWLHVYEEFSPYELLCMIYRMHGEAIPEDVVQATLQRLQLAERSDDHVRLLSSGLRQRVLLAMATLRSPALLLLDEPSITLDGTGKALVRAEIERHRLAGGVVILATNDPEEAAWCTSTTQLVI